MTSSSLHPRLSLASLMARTDDEYGFKATSACDSIAVAEPTLDSESQWVRQLHRWDLRKYKTSSSIATHSSANFRSDDESESAADSTANSEIGNHESLFERQELGETGIGLITARLTMLDGASVDVVRYVERRLAILADNSLQTWEHASQRRQQRGYGQYRSSERLCDDNAI